MVLVAFLLLTVSTLAVHGKPTGDSVGCVKMGEWTYCGRSDHYPQSEIDQRIAENDIVIHPFMMGSNLVNIEADLENRVLGPNGNCAMDIDLNFAPYDVRRGNITHYIVQSKFFRQTIPKVTCSQRNEQEASIENKEYYECFKDFVPAKHFNTKCEQRMATITLLMYIDNNVQPLMTEIDVDCVCARKERPQKYY